MKKSEPAPQPKRPELPEQPNPETLDLSKLTPLSPEIIARQATQNIGMWPLVFESFCVQKHTSFIGFNFAI
jgi:hypothetical protein